MSATEVQAEPALAERRSRTPADENVWRAFRAERRKLAAQLPLRVLVLVAILGPIAFTAILSSQSGVPADSLLGVWVHDSGLAPSVVVLSFAGTWGFPVMAGVLAGDLFSGEDRHGTWKTLLSRSCSRRDLFLGKVIAAMVFSIALVVLAAVASLLAGLIFVGSKPLVGLNGELLSTGRSFALVAASWLVSILPMLAFTSIAVLFSVATRNAIMGVLGPVIVALVMQLLAFFGAGSWMHMLLVGSAFDDWHGLLRSGPFFGPLVIGSVVSIVWSLASLQVAWLILARREFAGPPVARRAGWVVPVRVVLASAVVIAVLAAALNIGPATVTSKRVEAAITPAFNSLTLLQQRELGRTIPPGAKLKTLTTCRRRAGTSRGPGDDWTCTIDVFIPQPGANPFQQTPVTYDLSVKNNGCYKADAPPSFVGQQQMRDAGGQSVVNPLFTIYGCFNPM
ncbi:MAG: ABC transporter permease [Solirubrobacterales bacterium]|nr:ABC transporter permease [Solirubrobacterales bacterium]